MMEFPRVLRVYKDVVHGQKCTVTRYAAVPPDTVVRTVPKDRRQALQAAHYMYDETVEQMAVDACRNETDYEELRLTTDPLEDLIRWWEGEAYPGDNGDINA